MYKRQPKLCLLVTIILILLATIIGIITPVWQNGKIISSGDEIKAANEAQPRAVSVTYKDWADYTKLPSRYSYSTLFWTDKTQVINIDCELRNGNNFYGKEGKEFSFKITNGAIDMDGDLCDVIVSVDGIKECDTQTGNDMLDEITYPDGSIPKTKIIVTTGVSYFAGFTGEEATRCV